MPSQYLVRLTKDYLVFSAAHFITFNGNICERLHGHNYRVLAEVHGPLDENQYVVDFILLRDLLKEAVTRLDHHVLLPTRHPSIQVEPAERSVEVRFEDRRWVFPREDCVLLPMVQTTAELLAHYLGQELLSALQSKGVQAPDKVVIHVDECEGQWGVCELTPER